MTYTLLNIVMGRGRFPRLSMFSIAMLHLTGKSSPRILYTFIAISTLAGLGKVALINLEVASLA